MEIVPLLLITAIAVIPVSAEAKKLKPKYYKDCYSDYKAMQKLVPEPPIDIEGSAKTIGAAASVAGRFGGFGGLGGLGGAAQTAVSVANYSETIADVAAFTESMQESFPVNSERLRAYGDRMKTEAGEMDQVAVFVTTSQSCYAHAYVELKKSAESSGMKNKEVKKRQKEITTGVANISEMLSDATLYMDTNINAYNESLNSEASGAGFSLDKLMAVVNEAADVTGQVKGLSAPAYVPGRDVTVHAEAHRQSLKLQYEAAGLPNPNPAPVVPSSGYFGGMSSLSTLAAFGSIDPAMGASAALQMGVEEASQKSAGAGRSDLPVEMQTAQPSTEEKIEALRAAGEDIQPYIDAYIELKGLSDVQQSVSDFVNTSI